MRLFTNIIDVADLRELLKSPLCRVVDCRFDLMRPDKGREEYRDGHIPGAVYADLDKDLAGPITATSGRHPLPRLSEFEKLLNGWGTSEAIQCVVYDHANGATAARLWWMLRWVGHENVAVLNGGFAAWTNSGAEISQENPVIAPTVCSLRPDPQAIATTSEISAAVQSGRAFNLIDARDAQRFAGIVEPIDALAGHIPGAVNLPFQTTINADGTWRKHAELARMWREALEAGAEGPVTAMCGSGVTACHILVTAHLLGLTVPRLYVGSWSEWIREDSRAIAAANQPLGENS